MSRATVAVAVPPALRALFFTPETWRRLADLGELRCAGADTPLGDPAAYADLVGPARVVVTSWGCAPLDGALLATAPGLELLVHTGASVKALVTPASFAHGVRISQAGEAMAYAVGEQALALTLALLHRVNRFDHALRHKADWDRAKVDVPPRRELRGSRG